MDIKEPSTRVATRVIGGGIRQMREERGLTLEKLAAHAHISYQYLSGIETGKENFSIAILEKIARALEVPLPDLVSAAYGRGPGKGDLVR